MIQRLINETLTRKHSHVLIQEKNFIKQKSAIVCNYVLSEDQKKYYEPNEQAREYTRKELLDFYAKVYG